MRAWQTEKNHNGFVLCQVSQTRMCFSEFLSLSTSGPGSATRKSAQDLGGRAKRPHLPLTLQLAASHRAALEPPAPLVKPLLKAQRAGGRAGPLEAGLIPVSRIPCPQDPESLVTFPLPLPKGLLAPCPGDVRAILYIFSCT